MDAFWARSSSTIANNLQNIKKIIRLLKELGLSESFKSEDLIPSLDYCGYELAIDIVLYSTSLGRYSKYYIQFDTIRALRTASRNFEKVSSFNSHKGLTITNAMGIYWDIDQASTQSA